MAPEDCLKIAQRMERGGTDVVIEFAGAEDTFRLVWHCARPYAIVTVVDIYAKPQILSFIDEAHAIFEIKRDGVIKLAII